MQASGFGWPSSFDFEFEFAHSTNSALNSSIHYRIPTKYSSFVHSDIHSMASSVSATDTHANIDTTTDSSSSINTMLSSQLARLLTIKQPAATATSIAAKSIGIKTAPAASSTNVPSLCRFFHSPNGCRNGQACKFIHSASAANHQQPLLPFTYPIHQHSHHQQQFFQPHFQPHHSQPPMPMAYIPQQQYPLAPWNQPPVHIQHHHPMLLHPHAYPPQMMHPHPPPYGFMPPQPMQQPHPHTFIQPSHTTPIIHTGNSTNASADTVPTKAKQKSKVKSKDSNSQSQLIANQQENQSNKGRLHISAPSTETSSAPAVASALLPPPVIVPVSESIPSSSPISSSLLCVFFSSGRRCSYGAHCKFKHESPEGVAAAAGSASTHSFSLSSSSSSAALNSANNINDNANQSPSSPQPPPTPPTARLLSASYLAATLKADEARRYRSAGVLPFRRSQTSTNNPTIDFLFGLESHRSDASRNHRLVLLGGQREVLDVDYFHTAAREFCEETHGVLCCNNNEIQTENETINRIRNKMVHEKNIDGKKTHPVLWYAPGSFALVSYELESEEEVSVVQRFEKRSRTKPSSSSSPSASPIPVSPASVTSTSTSSSFSSTSSSSSTRIPKSEILSLHWVGIQDLISFLKQYDQPSSASSASSTPSKQKANDLPLKTTTGLLYKVPHFVVNELNVPEMRMYLQKLLEYTKNPNSSSSSWPIPISVAPPSAAAVAAQPTSNQHHQTPSRNGRGGSAALHLKHSAFQRSNAELYYTHSHQSNLACTRRI